MPAGRLDERDAARLLAAATIVDLILLVLLTRVIGALALRPLLGDDSLPYYVALFVVLYLIYIALTEILLAGRSLGRMCLQLQLRASDGTRLPWSSRVARGLRRLGTLGLGGLDVTRASRWDRKSGAAWASPMAPRPMTDWRIVVVTGSQRGRIHKLGALQGWSRKEIRIGRDAKWADIALPDDPRVSGRHAILRLRSDRLQVLDHGTEGSGSSHGTFVNGSRLPAGRWVDLSSVREFSVANVRLYIDR